MPANHYLFEYKKNLKIPLASENILGRESGLKTDTMSRRHVQIVTKEHRWFLADLNSTNGTYLNGKKIKTREWYSLKVGDEIEFGGMIFNLMGPQGREADVEKPRAETVSQTLPREGAATSKMAVMSKGDEAAPGEERAIGQEATLLPRALAYGVDVLAYALAAYVLRMIAAGVPHAVPSLQVIAFMGMGLVATKLLGYTLGKMMFGLRVVHRDDSPLDWRTAALREVAGKGLALWGLPAILTAGFLTLGNTIGALAGLATLSVIWIVVLWQLKRDGRAPWDRWFGTKVVHPTEE